MKPKRSVRTLVRLFGASIVTSITLTGTASAADVAKANNADALNLTTSWSLGALPTASDVALWNSTVTAANNPALGADASWGGIKVTNPGGAVTIGTGANGLTIGASGVDMSSATQDAVLAPGWFVLNANQTWNVASGRTLRLSKAAATAASSDVDGSGNLTIGGSGTVDANQGTTGTGAGWSNFSGKVTVNSGATLRGVGSNAFAWGTSTATDAITLNGGTWATGGTLVGAVGNWTWSNPVTLAASTTSYLDNMNLAGTGRTLTLSGVISGSGNIELKNTSAINDTGFRYLFSATNTYSGTTTLNGTSRTVELTGSIGTTAGAKSPFGAGAVTANSATVRLQAGSTGNAMSVANNFNLNNSTFIADDGVVTYGGNFTLTGANTFNVRWSGKNAILNGVIQDGASAGSFTKITASTSLFLNGVNTYTGGTTSTGGNIFVSSSKGLGTGLVTLDGGVLYFNPTTVGGTSTVSSIRTRSDLLLGNNVLLDITSGNLLMRMTNGFWIKASGTGTVGRLTSSSGTLNLPSVDGSWVTTTGTLTSADHQIQTPIVDFNGSTPLAVTKSGVNDLQLTVANTYTGGTTINGGRIRVNTTSGFGTGAVTVNAGGSAMLNTTGTFANNFTIAGTGVTEATGNLGAIRFANNTISGNVTVASGGARIGGLNAVTGTITGTLSGTGALEINSSAATHNSAIILSGDASGYSGATTVSQGSLTIAGNFGGSVAKAAGTTLTNNGSIAGDHTHTTGVLQGTGSFGGNLTLNGSTAADVLNVVSGSMHVAGDVTLSGTTTVRASGLGGTVTVLTYDGVLSGDKTNLSLEDAASFRAGTDFNTDTPGIITLDVVGVPITWTNGAANLTWNTTDNNWNNAGNPDKYYQSDAVTFGDTGAGTISLVGNIAPSSITINNSTGNDYTFTGTAGNVISGTTGIAKSGAGALTLASANTFLGAVSLSGGLTTFSARQAYTGGTTVSGGAILDLTGGGGEGGTIQGTVNITGTGSIVRATAGDATGWGVVTNRISAINVSNGGELQINNGSANQTFSNMAITLTGGSITKGPGAAAFNGNFDCFNGSTSITSNASADTSVIGTGVNVGLRQPNTTITTALGTTTSGIDLQIDGSINNSPANWTTPNLVKAGPGTLCLNNPLAVGIGTSAVYSGATTINAGTLIVGTGGTTGNIGTGAITNNGSLIFNRSDEITIAGAISGTGTIEKKGAGTLNLTGGGAHSGDTLVSSGTLRLGTVAHTGSTFRATTGGTLTAATTAAVGTSTAVGLDLNGGGIINRLSTAASDKFDVTNLSVNAASTVTCVANGPLQVGNVIPLIDYTGSIGGASGFAGLSLASSGNPHYSFALVDNTTDTRVDASVTAVDAVVWTGSLNGTWDVLTTSNWKTESNNLASLFYDYDAVKFTDAGSAAPVVSLFGDIKPAVVEFDSTINYELTGDGIVGSASLVKKNSGTAKLNNANAYTGATTVNAGTLELGDSGSIAAASAITNNATFAINRSVASTFTNVVAGSGSLVKRGTGDLTLNAANAALTGSVVVEQGTMILGSAASLGTNAAGLVVQSGATVNLNGITLGADETVSLAGTGVAGFAATGNATIQGAVILTGDATIGDSADTRINFGTNAEPINLIGGSSTLTKAGISRIWYRGVANGVGNSLGSLVINGGTFGIETYDNALGSVPVTVNTGGILSAWANGPGTVPTTQSTIITLNGGTLGSDFSGQTWTGPITLTADSTLGATTSALNFTITNVISESGGSRGLTKTQTSTVTLSGVNTYTGNTTVNAGTIDLAASGGLKFVIGANGVNNKVTGAGTAALNGTFTLDLTGAAIADGNSWTLVDTTTKSFGATFAVTGFTKSGTIHTKVDGSNTWTFDEATGALSLDVAQGYTSWVDGFGLAAGDKDPTDDPDADGFNNLMEYVLGGNPATGSTSIAPTGAKSGGDFILTFSRNDLAQAGGDVAITVEYGNDLSVWGSVAVPAASGPVGGVTFNITDGSPNDTVAATIPTSGAPKFFARVKGVKP